MSTTGKLFLKASLLRYVSIIGSPEPVWYMLLVKSISLTYCYWPIAFSHFEGCHLPILNGLSSGEPLQHMLSTLTRWGTKLLFQNWIKNEQNMHQVINKWDIAVPPNVQPPPYHRWVIPRIKTTGVKRTCIKIMICWQYFLANALSSIYQHHHCHRYQSPTTTTDMINVQPQPPALGVRLHLQHSQRWKEKRVFRGWETPAGSPGEVDKTRTLP